MLRAASVALSVHRYSPKTEKNCVHWVLRFIRYHGRRHPRAMGAG